MSPCSTGLYYKKVTMEDDAPDAVRAECERIFKRFDVNNDGKISLSEFEEALKALGSTSPQEIQGRMAEIDKDGNGYFSLQQLMEFQQANPCLMAQVFKSLQSNSSLSSGDQHLAMTQVLSPPPP